MDEKQCFIDKIFAIHNQSDIKEAYAMIIGPDDTPYEGGFFFFHIQFDDTYPFAPPTVKTLTQGGGVRFNPNLYVNGKVCLSILGTWQGPEWSPLYNLKDILIAIAGQVLTENPLPNEPNWDFPITDSRCQNYNAILRHATFKYAIVDMLQGTIPIPKEYQSQFTSYMTKYILCNSTKYLKRIDTLIKTDHNKIFSVSYDSQKAQPNYINIQKDFNDCLKKLTDK